MNDLRAIEISSFAKITRPKTLGKVPKLEWLSISALYVDPQYQREISGKGRNNIRRIATQFNWSMFGTVMVAAIGGSRFAIVDGQHRTTAAALCGIEKVPCQIIEAPVGEQAAAFRAINGNTTKPHTIQLFHAAVTAGEPAAIAVLDCCKAAGIRISKSLGPLRDYETYCVGAISKGIARHGADLVALALRAIVHSGDGRGEELNRTIIVAVTEVLARNKPWQADEAVLKQAFEEFNLEEMWREATATAARVKGSSGLDVLQASLTKKLSASFKMAA